MFEVTKSGALKSCQNYRIKVRCDSPRVYLSRVPLELFSFNHTHTKSLLHAKPCADRDMLLCPASLISSSVRCSTKALTSASTVVATATSSKSKHCRRAFFTVANTPTSTSRFSGSSGRRLLSSFLSPRDFILDSSTSSSSTSPGPGTPLTTPQIPPLRIGINLSRHGVNLNELASKGKLDIVVGRDDEIRQAVQVLSRRRKNNPCLVGEPGVGKTSIAEGLAQLMVSGDVPSGMRNKTIISLDIASLLAGTKVCKPPSS